jgi:hypothetical protein
MIGVFNKKSTLKHKLNITSSLKQAISQFFAHDDKFVMYDKLADVYCIYESQLINYDETRSPIYKYVVEQEMIEMHKLQKLIESCGGEIVRYNTDCISAYFKNSHQITQIKEMVKNTYWDDEKTTLKYKFEEKANFEKFHEKMPKYFRKESYQPNLDKEWKVINDDNNFDNLVNQVIIESKFGMRHLSFTNKKRIDVNTKCMSLFIKMKNEEAIKKKKKKPTVHNLEKLAYDKNSQDVSLIEGMPVIARITCKEYKIANNDTYTISKFENDTLWLKSDSDETNVLKLKFSEFQKYFFVAFCITVHKSQGATFDHTYTIHEWNLFDDRLKYVALSRATQKEYINIM